MKPFNLHLFFSLMVSVSGLYAGGPVLTDSHTGSQPPIAGEPGDARPIVLDLVLHDKKKILNLLKRAEMLATTPNSAERPEKIALVLHGPEIRYFQISQYLQNREIVDLAAKLDAFNVIDIKMCNTAMSSMGIHKADIPAFIEIVPYGPAEIERLQSKGFIKL